MPYKNFETNRLLLRPTDKADAEFVLRLMNTPKWLQFIGDRKVVTIAQAESYIENKMIPQLERLGYSNYTIVRKEDGEKMGSCGLYDREELEDIDIGFALLPQFEGKGYGYEAASRILQAAAWDFGLKKISGITNRENIASCNLLERLGLSQIGMIRLNGEEEDILLYQMEL